MANTEEVDSENILRVMVATDNHLGYAEKDAIRGEDSFTAFEEILEMAVAEDVDFILLGGDLFHDAVPSQNALHKCMTMLRRYTFGDKPIAIEILSDQKVNFTSAINNSVNYEDPNLNISIPVFSIHGNHDDPSGFGRLSSLDLLSTTGLVNYFGRWTDLTKVEITPILLRKGTTQLALYGLSHIHDGRLARLFENAKVVVERPSDEEGEWFHLMVLHQNRADRGPKNYLPEEVLPDFLNLVVWGHEHDCRIEPEYSYKRDFYVCQPGSSVPTSLAEGEALSKHVGLLEVYKSKFNMKPLKLQTVRPFVFESVNLLDLTEELRLDEGDVGNKVRKMAEERVKAMIHQAKDQLTGHPKQPTLPLIRLRIVFEDEAQMFNAIRFGQAFHDQVANPIDMVHFKKALKRTKHEGDHFDKKTMDTVFKESTIDTSTRVEDLVDRYFEEKGSLKLMPSHALSEMCFRLVERRDMNAAENILRFYKEAALEHLMEKLPSEDQIDEELQTLSQRMTRDTFLKMLDERGDRPATASTTVKNRNETVDITEDEENDALMFVDEKKPAKEAKPAARGGRGSRGGARGRGSRSATASAGNTTTSSRASKAMPKLDVSIASRSTRNNTLLDNMFTKTSQPTRNRGALGPRQQTFLISDDSD